MSADRKEDAQFRQGLCPTSTPPYTPLLSPVWHGPAACAVRVRAEKQALLLDFMFLF